jgi:hypothetical protein
MEALNAPIGKYEAGIAHAKVPDIRSIAGLAMTASTRWNWMMVVPNQARSGNQPAPIIDHHAISDD